MASFAGILSEELDSTKRYNPRTGDVIVRHWKGAPANIALIEAQAKNLKYAFSTGWDGPYKTIAVEYPESAENEPNTPLSEKWECDSNYLQKDIWQVPSVQTELAKIGGTIIGQNNPLVQQGATEAADVRATFRNDFETVATGRDVSLQRIDSSGALIEGEETTVTLAILLDIARIYGADRSVFLKLARDLSKGVTTWEVEQYVATHTRVTNLSSAIKAARENVGKIHTAAFITNQLPAEVKFEAPEGGFWLKRIPKVNEIEKSKWEIIQEYWHTDTYSDLLYPDAPIA